MLGASGRKPLQCMFENIAWFLSRFFFSLFLPTQSGYMPIAEGHN
jgi:hypothetical protein